MNARGRLLAAAHIAAKDLGLDEEMRRAVQARITGHASCGAMNGKELAALLDEFKRLGWRRRAPKRAGRKVISGDARQGKIRALWLALYHLGEVREPSEQAIDAFVKAQTGIDSLRFLDGPGLGRVINALRGWCARVGLRSPAKREGARINALRARCGLAPEDTGFCAKVLLVEALWSRLKRTGLDTFLMNQAGVMAPAFVARADIDRVIERLGGWLRREREGREK